MEIIKTLVNPYLIGACVAITGILYQLGILSLVFYLLLYLSVALFGMTIGFVFVVTSGEKIRPPPQETETVANQLLTKMAENLAQESEHGPRRVVISKNMDEAIKEVFDLIVQHYVLPWYKDLTMDTRNFVAVVEDDMWESLEKLMYRFAKVDLVRFITKDIVNKMHTHFQDLKQSSPSNSDEITKAFLLHPCLNSEDAELEFLRKAADVLIWTMTPERIGKCTIVRHLVREIITCQVLKPCVDMICDPDYINQTILGHLEYREQLAEKHKRTYAYAASYEDFIQLIHDCHDIEVLKQIRYHIMTEIMQATTIENLKKERGLDTDKKGSPKSHGKGDLLKARNLKRYINQCTVAKAQCEKRIRLLGGPEYKFYGKDSPTREDSIDGTRRKVLTFQEIMDNPNARKYFMKFLKREKKDNLLGFWIAVEKLKFLSKKDLALHASHAYQAYIATSKPITVERTFLKGMEAFLVGNKKDPDSFYEAQNDIYVILDEDFYPSFIVSDFYQQYVNSLEDTESSDMAEWPRLTDEHSSIDQQDEGSDMEDGESTGVSIAEQTNYAVTKLQVLDERVANKLQAWQSIKNSQRPDSKMLQKLEREIEAMKLERRQLESHIDRTDMWCEYIGDWQVNICNAEVMQEQDKEVPYYVIVVHLRESLAHGPSTTGWVVSHKLTDFYVLHQKLRECCRWLQKRELPKIKNRPFKSVDREFMDKSKKVLEQYLVDILADESLRHSEDLYSFLIPSPEVVKKITTKDEKKPAFTLASIFKNFQAEFFPQEQEEKDDDDEEEDSAPDRRDSIAESLYALIGEIFELKGVFKWMRKTLIIFVQVTFGGTINKQIREGVNWVVSEPMMIYYLNYFRDAMWPNGEIAPPYPPRSDEERLNTKLRARLKLLKNIPDALQNLLGKKNSKLGTIKIFNAFQDVRTNKHLFYVLFELVLLELCPELKDPKIVKKVEEDQRRKRREHTKVTMAMAM